MSVYLRLVSAFLLVVIAGCSDTQVPEPFDVSPRDPSNVDALPRSIACDDLSARLTARAYMLSTPLIGLEDDLIPLMAENRSYFERAGGAIRCMQALSAALLRGGLQQYSRFRGSSAAETFGSMPEGLGHLPGQVDDSLRSYGSNMFMMGQELAWLASVLPPAASGDYAPYREGGTLMRQSLSQAMPAYQMVCQIDPSACELMLSMYRQMAPSIEEEIYALARQIGQ